MKKTPYLREIKLQFISYKSNKPNLIGVETKALSQSKYVISNLFSHVEEKGYSFLLSNYFDHINWGKFYSSNPY